MTEPPNEPGRTDRHAPLSESELEGYLTGDSPLSREYRAASADIEPSLALDQRILDAAKSALDAGAGTDTMDSVRRYRPRWDLALGAAAVIVLSVSMVSWLGPLWAPPRDLASMEPESSNATDFGSSPKTTAPSALDRTAPEPKRSVREFRAQPSIGATLDTAVDNAIENGVDSAGAPPPSSVPEPNRLDAPVQRAGQLAPTHVLEKRLTQDRTYELRRSNDDVGRQEMARPSPTEKRRAVLADRAAAAASVMAEENATKSTRVDAAGNDAAARKSESDTGIDAWLEQFEPLIEARDLDGLEALLGRFREHYPKYRLDNALGTKLVRLGITEAKLGPWQDQP